MVFGLIEKTILANAHLDCATKASAVDGAEQDHPTKHVKDTATQWGIQFPYTVGILRMHFNAQ